MERRACHSAPVQTNTNNSPVGYAIPVGAQDRSEVEWLLNRGQDTDHIGHLALSLGLSLPGLLEAARRGLLSFRTHRKAACWRLGDEGNGSVRRLDGQPFQINGEQVKAVAETRGADWHRLIGLDEALANARRDILLTGQGSKDALAAVHFF